MPRKSSAAIALGNLNVSGRPTPIGVPASLPASLKGIVADLIASQAPQHFRDGDDYLLEQYAQSIIAAREAFAHLEREGFVVNGKANAWAIILEKAHRSSVALAGRLRLAPQQRMDQEKAARERSPNFGYRSLPPWQPELKHRATDDADAS
jgi:hypothetical protein